MIFYLQPNSTGFYDEELVFILLLWLIICIAVWYSQRYFYPSWCHSTPTVSLQGIKALLWYPVLEYHSEIKDRIKAQRVIREWTGPRRPLKSIQRGTKGDNSADQWPAGHSCCHVTECKLIGVTERALKTQTPNQHTHTVPSKNNDDSRRWGNEDRGVDSKRQTSLRILVSSCVHLMCVSSCMSILLRTKCSGGKSTKKYSLCRLSELQISHHWILD